MLSAMLAEGKDGFEQSHFHGVIAERLGATDPRLLRLLAEEYTYGRVVERDEGRAFGLFKRSADAGLPSAQLAVAYIYGHCFPEYTFKDVPRDQEEFECYLDLSASGGCLEASSFKGGCLLYGQDNLAKSPGEAVSLLVKAASKRKSQGLLILGDCLQEGLAPDVLPKSPMLAKLLYDLAEAVRPPMSPTRAKGRSLLQVASPSSTAAVAKQQGAAVGAVVGG